MEACLAVPDTHAEEESCENAGDEDEEAHSCPFRVVFCERR